MDVNSEEDFIASYTALAPFKFFSRNAMEIGLLTFVNGIKKEYSTLFN